MKTILIIEDNDEIRENTAELLEISGYKVITARNGKEGFYKSVEDKPDIILCDVLMPKSSGIEFFKLVKQDKLTRTIPLIFLSAGSAPASVQKGLEQGAEGYLSKPFSEEQLLNAIRKHM